MPVSPAPLPLTPSPDADRPLAGMTVLLVEDSRFASEAVRLLCLKSGARIRRADSLRAARRHLGVYLPSVAIIDLGLPDGPGLGLIESLAEARPRVPVMLATSGDDRQFPAALAAGADGVLGKPVESLAIFQKTVLDAIPPADRPACMRLVSGETVTPDLIAYRDDLAHVSELLTLADDNRTLDYVAQFLAGVGRSAHDEDLQTAAETLARRRQAGGSFRSDLARVSGLLQDRLQTPAAI